MPKFQSTRNPKEIIEVSEERASIFRSAVQDGWQEYFEDSVNDVSPTSEQSTSKAPRKRGVKRKSGHVQQVNRRTSKSDEA